MTTKETEYDNDNFKYFTRNTWGILFLCGPYCVYHAHAHTRKTRAYACNQNASALKAQPRRVAAFKGGECLRGRRTLTRQ